MIKVLAILAAGVGVLQPLLMGFIGYPIARHKKNMEAFHKSGFYWWLITIFLVIIAALVLEPSLFAVMQPSTHNFTVARFAVAVGAGLAAVLLVELVADRVSFGEGDVARKKRVEAKFDQAFPPAISNSFPRMLVALSLMAVAEEAVFRAIALGGLWHEWGFNKVLAAGLVSALFGLCHWYYGLRQIVIKTITGTVLTWSALTGGWVAAATAHVLFNIVVLILRYRAEKTKQKNLGRSAGAATKI